MPETISLKDAVEARNSIDKEQRQAIANLYEKWADEVGKKAEYFKHRTTESSIVQEMQMRELEKMLRATATSVNKEIESTVKSGMTYSANAVVESNTKWLESLGFDSSKIDIAFNHVPDQVVSNILSGNLYEGGWSLSKSIWGDTNDTLKDLHEVIAGGLAENKSIYEISKDIEDYVRPSAAKNWNLTMKDGKKIYPKQVDYNAQRLARTLSQHAYQQSVVATSKKNPFILGIKWRSTGSRACPICLARNGQIYSKNDLPLDHPNGMCTMEPVTDPNMDDRLINWVKGANDPEIDEFAKEFGYTGETHEETFSKKYSMPGYNVGAWFNKLPAEAKAEAKEMKLKSGMKWEDWYAKYMSEAKPTVHKAKEVAFSEIQDKYLSPYGFSPKNMPKDFDEWSHLISDSDAKEILKAMGTDWGDPHPYQKILQYYNANLANLSTEAKNAAKVANKVTKQVANTMANVATDSVTPDYKTWIDLMKSQTESSMLEKEQEWMTVMGKEGKESLKWYTGSHYEEMNAYLRYIGAGMSEAEAADLLNMSEQSLNNIKNAVSALESVRLDKAYVLRRGTDLGDIAGAFMSGDFDENKSTLGRKSAEELNSMFAGATGNLFSFTSTSSLYGRGFDGSVEVILYAPQGTSASSIMSISRYGVGEGETLLNAGTKVKCTKIEESDGHMHSRIRMFLEVIA